MQLLESWPMWILDYVIAAGFIPSQMINHMHIERIEFDIFIEANLWWEDCLYFLFINFIICLFQNCKKMSILIYQHLLAWGPRRSSVRAPSWWAFSRPLSFGRRRSSPGPSWRATAWRPTRNRTGSASESFFLPDLEFGQIFLNHSLILRLQYRVTTKQRLRFGTWASY